MQSDARSATFSEIIDHFSLECSRKNISKCRELGVDWGLTTNILQIPGLPQNVVRVMEESNNGEMLLNQWIRIIAVGL